MSRARRLTAALALTGALLALTACASSVDPIERLGRKAAEKVTPRPHRAVPQPSGRTGSPPPRPTAPAGQADRADRTDEADRRDEADRTDEADRRDEADRTGGTDRTDEADRTDRVGPATPGAPAVPLVRNHELRPGVPPTRRESPLGSPPVRATGS
ncbi:hypothetical protein ACIGEZ_14680 [Streptomyces sp. NPDC085481]|uniref:hypothetical protein n=1 Tax=Streptomyces sp. NPDC085481 TaxID=3365727 RepID=UPI0037D59294